MKKRIERAGWCIVPVLLAIFPWGAVCTGAQAGTPVATPVSGSSNSLLAGGACESSRRSSVWDLRDEAPAMKAASCRWESSRILLIGEVHGTAEVPAFVGGLLSKEAERRPIVLALERTDEEEAAINAFLASDGSPEARRKLTLDKGWSGSFSDGRSSVAMLDLLDVVRQRRKAGRHVEVLLTEKMPKHMSVLRGPGAAQRYVEKSMADTLREAAVGDAPGTLVVALMGAYHLRLSDAGPYGPSVAGQLDDLSPTLAFVDGAGTAWNCVDNTCAPHRVAWGSQAGLAGDAAGPKAGGRTSVVTVRFPVLSASPPAAAHGEDRPVAP